MLDCRYSARATVPVRNGALLTSADRDEQALAPAGEQYTAFSGALMTALADGIATASALLTLDVVHDHLTRILTGAGRPAPVLHTGNAVHGLMLAPNAADRSIAAPRIEPAGGFGDRTCPYRGPAMVRQRSTVGECEPAPAAGSPAENALVATFVHAWESADVDALVALLTEDVFMSVYVLTLAGDRIRAMTRFENTVLPSFGLPRTLPSR